MGMNSICMPGRCSLNQLVKYSIPFSSPDSCEAIIKAPFPPLASTSRPYSAVSNSRTSMETVASYFFQSFDILFAAVAAVGKALDNPIRIADNPHAFRRHFPQVLRHDVSQGYRRELAGLRVARKGVFVPSEFLVFRCIHRFGPHLVPGIMRPPKDHLVVIHVLEAP